MPIHVALNSFVTAQSKEDQLNAGPLSNGCFIALKYANGYFSLGHVGSELYLPDICKKLRDNISNHGKVMLCYFYYTASDTQSIRVHAAVKMHLSIMFKVFTEWGTPKTRSEPCHDYNKIAVSHEDAIVKFPREKIREILGGNDSPAKKFRLS